MLCLSSSPPLADCLLNLAPAAGSEVTLHRGRGWSCWRLEGKRREQIEAWQERLGGWWRGGQAPGTLFQTPSRSPEPITARLTFSWLLQYRNTSILVG